MRQVMDQIRRCIQDQIRAVLQECFSGMRTGEDANGEHAQALSRLNIHRPITDHQGVLRGTVQVRQCGLQMRRMGFNLRDVIPGEKGLTIGIELRKHEPYGDVTIARHNAHGNIELS
jgi:hypothetical protein